MQYALALTFLLIAASGGFSVRNVYTYWGSWEPLKRMIKPNPLRPVVYVRKHGTVIHRGRSYVIRWPDLNVILGSRERVAQLGDAIGNFIVADHILRMPARV